MCVVVLYSDYIYQYNVYEYLLFYVCSCKISTQQARGGTRVLEEFKVDRSGQFKNRLRVGPNGYEHTMTILRGAIMDFNTPTALLFFLSLSKLIAGRNCANGSRSVESAKFSTSLWGREPTNYIHTNNHLIKY